MSYWYERMTEIREQNGMTQLGVANLMGIDYTAYNRYEKGNTKTISRSLEKKLLKAFTENEFMYIESGVVAEENSVVSDSGMIYNQKEKSVTLDYYPDSYASAGGGAYPYLQKSKPMSFSKSFLEIHLGLMNYKNIFILNTIGESMEPTLKDGSLIFVNPIENEGGQVRDGGIYVLMCDNTILVKRVTHNPVNKTYTLISDHPEHENITIDGLCVGVEDGCHFMGRVVGSFDRV